MGGGTSTGWLGRTENQYSFQVIRDIPDEDVVETEISGEQVERLLSTNKPSYEEWEAVTGDSREEYHSMEFPQGEYESADVAFGVVFRKQPDWIPEKGLPRLEPEIHYQIDAKGAEGIPDKVVSNTIRPNEELYDEFVEIMEEAIE